MWPAMESNDIITQIYSYKTNSFEEVRHGRSDTAEDVCRELCRRWKFRPLVQLLFGLRHCKTKLWLACCRQLVEGEKYEFRIRFKVPKITDLQQHDENCYEYFYQQVRHDVLNNAIKEFEYPNLKHEISGLCVIDMYVEMIEKNRNVDYMKHNYKKYFPHEHTKQHKFFLCRRIDEYLKKFNPQHTSASFLKHSYLKEVAKRAPSYLNEEYQATAINDTDDNSRQRCHVVLQVNPFHPEEPGLRIQYPYSWKHIAKFVDFYTIQIDETTNEVSLEIQNSPIGIPIRMKTIQEIESFVSCISGYYRLMVKWSMDLCPKLVSPWLKYLNDNKLHGPIGGAFSYNKIEEKNSSVGSFITRQCESVFDTFYIDIVTKENQLETFRIIRDTTRNGDKWKLHVSENVTREYEDLIDLIKSIETNGKKTRIPSSLNDKAPFLLLCQPTPNQQMMKEANGLRENNRPMILSASEDLRLYNWTQREWGDGLFTRMKAEIINRKKNREVTLKVLKQASLGNHLQDFIALGDLWAKLDISEIVKLHGITLRQPISYVMESISCGPLDELLRNPKHRKHITLLDLVDTAFSLAKALHYLQENRIVHGRIRCSTLQVIEFIPNERFLVKLGDPGLPIELTENDVPWIAIECYDDLSSCRENLKSDIWSYATTIWEIFSRGASMAQFHNNRPMQFFKSKNRPPKPAECAQLDGIYELMLKGWDVDPDHRFPPQTIFSYLLSAKTKLARDYCEISNPGVKMNGKTSKKINGQNGTLLSHNSRRTIGSDYYTNGSVLSGATDQTFLTQGTTQAYIEHYGSSIASSNQSNDGGSSQMSLLNGSEGSNSTIVCFDDDRYLGEVPGVLELTDSIRVIFQGKLGSGNFGRVFKGLMITSDDAETEVAIKLLRQIESNENFRDFQREAKIMKELNHENIVKIYGYHEHPLSIIMEHMKHGSLYTYLSYNKPTLTVRNLLQFASSIAKGMNYLESMKIVHRDLAARNVLVGNGGRVKIADFGLAQITDGEGYYHYLTNHRSLPIKWYAPETFMSQQNQSRKFSHKSDVWSFGVTLYEIFTFGESPNLNNNPNLDANQILDLLTAGVRLECPRFCPQSVYEEIMYVCWNFKASLRPKFSELSERLNHQLIENGESV